MKTIRLIAIATLVLLIARPAAAQHYDASGLKFGTTDMQTGTAPSPGQALIFDGNGISGGAVVAPPITSVALLPSCNASTVEISAYVTDCQACTWGSTCVGLGQIFCPEVCSPVVGGGFAWMVLGGGTGGGGNSVVSLGLGFNFMGTPAANLSEAFTCPYPINFPANFAAVGSTEESDATCGTNPTSVPDVYVIKVNNTIIGQDSISTSCVSTFTSVGGTNQACLAGQRLEVDAPASPTGKDIAITLVHN